MFNYVHDRLIESLESRTFLSVGHCAGGGSAPAAPAAMHQSAPKANGQRPSRMQHAGSQRQAEIHFLTEMIDHHASAVEMGKLAVRKAVHPELAELGRGIVETQTAEIEQMQAWLKDWYGIEHDPRLSRRDVREIRALKNLGGSAFEVKFLKGMIHHHAMGVMMSRQIIPRASHDELKELARDIIEAQTAEIEQMRDWLADWYDEAVGHAGGDGGMGGGGMNGMGGGGH